MGVCPASRAYLPLSAARRRVQLTSLSVLVAEAAGCSNRASRHAAQSKFNLNLASQLRLLLANNDTGLHSSRSALTHVNDTKCGGNGSNSSAAEGGAVGGAWARAVRCGFCRTGAALAEGPSPPPPPPPLLVGKVILTATTAAG